MIRFICTLLLPAIALFLSGCSGKDDTAYSGKVYTPTNTIATAFQYTQVPRPCRVFAETLAMLPANQSGKDIQNLVFKEAGAKGADLVLIGQTRKMEDDVESQFIYYGPVQEYLCADNWCGWKFGYDEWEDQGEWVNIGLSEWGNKTVFFEEPLMMQVVFLRCR